MIISCQILAFNYVQQSAIFKRANSFQLEVLTARSALGTLLQPHHTHSQLQSFNNRRTSTASRLQTWQISASSQKRSMMYVLAPNAPLHIGLSLPSLHPSSQSLLRLTHHKGASPGEQLIEAARRNNVDLLHEVLEGCKTPEEASSLLNDTKTVLGNHIYHEAALRGNCTCPPPP